MTEGERQLQAAAGRPSALFSALSGGNAASLAFFGIASLAISLAFGSVSGALVSLALVAHGAAEWRFRGRALVGAGRARRAMAYNQAGLALSLTAYFAWQAMAIDEERLRALLAEPMLAGVLELYPAEVRDQLSAALPKALFWLYILAAGLSWVGCAALGIYYLKATEGGRARVADAGRGSDRNSQRGSGLKDF